MWMNDGRTLTLDCTRLVVMCSGNTEWKPLNIIWVAQDAHLGLLQFFQYLVPFRSRFSFSRANVFVWNTGTCSCVLDREIFLSSENNFPFFWYGFPDLLAKLSVYFATWYDVSVVGGQSFPMLQNLHGLGCIVMYDPLTTVVPFSGPPEVSEHHVNGQYCPRLIIYRRRLFWIFLPSFFFLSGFGKSYSSTSRILLCTSVLDARKQVGDSE